jgi:hypothetical protein
MPIRGKLVIVAILTVALLAASAAWWHVYRQGRRVLQLWGAATASRIRLASECELLWLQPAGTGHDSDLLIDGRRWSVTRRADLTNARGWVHARQALIEDRSYLWTHSAAPTERAVWEYAVRFRNDQGETLLVFDLHSGQVLEPALNRRADIGPIAVGLRTFFAEQLPNDHQLRRPGSKDA